MHILCKGLCSFPSCNTTIFIHANIYPISKPFICYTCIVHSGCCTHRFRSASFFNYNQLETPPPSYTFPRNTHTGTMPVSSLRYTLIFLQYHAWNLGLKLVPLQGNIVPTAAILYEQIHTTHTLVCLVRTLILQVTSYLCFQIRVHFTTVSVKNIAMENKVPWALFHSQEIIVCCPTLSLPELVLNLIYKL